MDREERAQRRSEDRQDRIDNRVGRSDSKDVSVKIDPKKREVSAKRKATSKRNKRKHASAFEKDRVRNKSFEVTVSHSKLIFKSWDFRAKRNGTCSLCKDEILKTRTICGFRFNAEEDRYAHKDCLNEILESKADEMESYIAVRSQVAKIEGYNEADSNFAPNRLPHLP